MAEAIRADAAAGESKDAAFAALCAYRCATIEQASIKAAALARLLQDDTLPADAVGALVGSFLPIAAGVG